MINVPGKHLSPMIRTLSQPIRNHRKCDDPISASSPACPAPAKNPGPSACFQGLITKSRWGSDLTSRPFPLIHCTLNSILHGRTIPLMLTYKGLALSYSCLMPIDKRLMPIDSDQVLINKSPMLSNKHKMPSYKHLLPYYKRLMPSYNHLLPSYKHHKPSYNHLLPSYKHQMSCYMQLLSCYKHPKPADKGPKPSAQLFQKVSPITS
jgi:hypothetical protein